jgi:hypothetical protein
MILECEIKTGGKWTIVGINDALRSFKGETMRCPACNGLVHAHKKYINGTPAHFEHKYAHKGCQLIPSSFNGHQSVHPAALK